MSIGSLLFKKVKITMLNSQKLDRINQKLTNSGICSELAESATQLVFGYGNPNAKVVFIGEAPGKNEDKEGRPFIGAAGKFLDEMLDNIGLKREEVYITNIVKYRPPNNRDPLPDKKNQFLPYLLEELEAIKPVIVVTLGRHSMNCFLPEEQIGKMHGQVIEKSGYIFVPLYHPAAALYNGAMRQLLIEDFNKIPVILENLNSTKKLKEKIQI
ncbi:MAG TPA: uracil-DNA glycosylase [Candidatus Saccharibacteria bacterium]|nr:uracil-DNA glycosylase [Candidatus Saccharibacteria bacterium]